MQNIFKIYLKRKLININKVILKDTLELFAFGPVCIILLFYTYFTPFWGIFKKTIYALNNFTSFIYFL